MFNKMIAQQTAKKEKLLDNFLKKHEAEYPFPEDVELICDIDYMGDGKPCHFMDIYRPRKIMKVLPSYIYGKHWKKSSFYPYINPENKEIIRNLPPSFLVTAYGDTLRNYSRQYAKAIKKAGVICHLEDYEVDKKLPHAFSTTFPEMEESKCANTQMVEFHLEDYEVDKKLPHAFSTTFPEMEESKRANTQMVEFLFKY